MEKGDRSSLCIDFQSEEHYVDEKVESGFETYYAPDMDFLVLLSFFRT
jgi:hypothetical protein